jgi:hypothetical protein
MNSKKGFGSMSVFQSVSDRDGIIQNGMERGVSDGDNKLDEIIVSMICEKERF